LSQILFTLAELIAEVEGDVQGDVGKDINIHAIAALKDADEHALSFLSNAQHQAELATTKAAAVLVASNLLNELQAPCPLIAVNDPYLAYAQLQQKFHPQGIASGNIHDSAIIADSASIADDVDIGAACVIGENCVLASGTILKAGCLIAENVNIGKNCLIHAGVKIESGCQLGNRVIVQAGAVIGSDGFGYAWSGQAYVKIPQVGRVVMMMWRLVRIPPLIEAH